MVHHARSSTPTYIGVFLALLVLTAVTVAVAYVDLHGANVLVALGIATLKAGLVIGIFMHARQGGSLVWATIITGGLFVAILLGFTISDYMTRAWLPS